MLKQKKFLAGLIGVFISVGILFAVLKGLDWAVFLAELKRIRVWYLPLLFLLTLLAFWLRALRWRYLLPQQPYIPTRGLFDAISVGFLATFILPFRAGEIVRPIALNRSQEVSFSSAFASVVTERAFDVLTLLCLFGLALSKLDKAPTYIHTAAYTLAVLAGMIVLLMFLAYWRSKLVILLIESVLALLLRGRESEIFRKLSQALRDFVFGLKAIASFKELFLVIFLSFALWLAVAVYYQACLWSFGEFPSLWVGLMVNLMIALAVAAPSAPGFIGTFQAGCVIALSAIYAYSQEFSVAYSVFAHGIQVLVIVLLGSFSLRNLGVALQEIQTCEK